MRAAEDSIAWRDPAASVFLALSLSFGVLFIFLTPPFQVPDEPAHFFRAYAISEGSFRLRTYDRIPAQPMPASLPAFAQELTGSRIGDQRSTITFDDIKRTMRYRLEPEKRVLMVVPLTPSGPVAFSAGGYVPLAYAPAAITLALGRIVDAPVLVMFYGARLVNLLMAALLCWAAIRSAPIGKRILAATALLPMAAFLRSSISPDGVLIALGLLAFALALEGAYEERWSQPLAPLLLVCFLLVASKPLYLLMPLLALLMIGRKRRSVTRRVSLGIAAALTAILGLVVATLWVVAPLQPAAEYVPGSLEDAHAQPQLTSMRGEAAFVEPGEINIQAQARNVLADPLSFLTLAASEYWSGFPALSYQFAGRFGWLDTPFPLTMRILLLALLVLLGLLDGRTDFSLTVGQRTILATIFAGTLALTAAILYLTWTPVGAGHIEGLQGRYFLPVAPALLLLMTSEGLATTISKRHLTWIMAIIATLGLTVAAWSMYSRFYGEVASPMMYMAGTVY